MSTEINPIRQIDKNKNLWVVEVTQTTQVKVNTSKNLYNLNTSVLQSKDITGFEIYPTFKKFDVVFGPNFKYTSTKKYVSIEEVLKNCTNKDILKHFGSDSGIFDGHIRFYISRIEVEGVTNHQILVHTAQSNHIRKVCLNPQKNWTIKMEDYCNASLKSVEIRDPKAPPFTMSSHGNCSCPLKSYLGKLDISKHNEIISQGSFAAAMASDLDSNYLPEEVKSIANIFRMIDVQLVFDSPPPSNEVTATFVSLNIQNRNTGEMKFLLASQIPDDYHHHFSKFE